MQPRLPQPHGWPSVTRVNVAQLAGDAVRAAQQFAAQHDAATDAGAEGEHDHRVVGVPRRAEAELGPGRDVGVVLHHDRQARRCESSSRSGSFRQARLGAKRTRSSGRRRSSRPHRCRPRATSCRRSSSVTTSTMTSSGLGRPRPVVSRRACARILPSSSTTPPSTLVPPISTPIVNDTRAFLPQPRLRRAGATATVAGATLVVRRRPAVGALPRVRLVGGDYRGSGGYQTLHRRDASHSRRGRYRSPVSLAVAWSHAASAPSPCWSRRRSPWPWRRPPWRQSPWRRRLGTGWPWRELPWNQSPWRELSWNRLPVVTAVLAAAVVRTGTDPWSDCGRSLRVPWSEAVLATGVRGAAVVVDAAFAAARLRGRSPSRTGRLRGRSPSRTPPWAAPCRSPSWRRSPSRVPPSSAWTFVCVDLVGAFVGVDLAGAFAGPRRARGRPAG